MAAAMLDVDSEVLPDSWLVVPFLLGFVVFRSPLGNACEEVFLELFYKTGLPGSAMAKNALERRGRGWDKKHERTVADDESCRSELWHLRQEILQERSGLRSL
jgi:hypothetical protein